MTTNDTLIEQIREHVEIAEACQDQADKSQRDAEKHRRYAGRKLKRLKQQLPKGATWKAYVREHCKLSRERADELIRVGEGTTTVEEVRERSKKRTASTAPKRPKRNGCYVTPIAILSPSPPREPDV